LREDKPRPLPSPWLALFQLMITAGLVVGLVYGFLFVLQASTPREVTVPNIEGLDRAAAEILLRHAGLEGEITGHRPSDTIEKAKVILANPKPGRRVKKGRSISLLISDGSAWTNAPDIREMSERRARSVLQEKALYLGEVRYIYHLRLPKGFVVAQLPPAGTRLPENSQVQAVISKGPRPGTPTAAPEQGSEEKATPAPQQPAQTEADTGQ